MAKVEIKISNLTSLPTDVQNNDMLAIVSNNKTYNVRVGKLLEALYAELEGKEDYLGLPIRDGYVLSSDIQGNRTWILDEGGGVPSGGLDQQILVKQGTVDGDVSWENQIIFKGTEIPDDNFGENGDTYIRYGMVEVPFIDGNLAGDDSDPQNVTGQFWNGNVNLYDGNGTDVEPIETYHKIDDVWVLHSKVPIGGNTSQVLMKTTNSDGDVKWGDVNLENIVFKGVDAPTAELGEIGDKYMQEIVIGDLPPVSKTANYYVEKTDTDIGALYLFNTYSQYIEYLDIDVVPTGGFTGNTPLSFLGGDNDIGKNEESTVVFGFDDGEYHAGDIITFTYLATEYTIVLDERFEYIDDGDLYYVYNTGYEGVVRDPSWDALADYLTEAGFNSTSVLINILTIPKTSAVDYKEYTKTNDGWKRVFVPIVFKGKDIPLDSYGENGDKFMLESVAQPIDFSVNFCSTTLNTTDGFPIFGFNTTTNTIPGISGGRSCGYLNGISSETIGLQYFGAQLLGASSSGTGAPEGVLAFQLKNGAIWSGGDVFIDINGVPHRIPTPAEAFIFDGTITGSGSGSGGGGIGEINAYLIFESDTFLTAEESATVRAIAEIAGTNTEYHIYENANLSGTGGYTEYKEYTKRNNSWYELSFGQLVVTGDGYSLKGRSYRGLVGEDAINLGADCNSSGDFSFAIGYYATASGNYSTAIGYNTIASGKYSTAIGYSSIASGKYSTAIGYRSIASGDWSTAIGYHNTASGHYATSVGFETLASGEQSHSEGHGTEVYANDGHVEGHFTFIELTSHASHAEGFGTTVSPDIADASTKIQITTAGGSGSGSGGGYQTQYGTRVIPPGGGATNIEGNHAEGMHTWASGFFGSHAEGYATMATGFSTHAEGYKTLASGDYAHAGGSSSEATAYVAFSHGRNAIASGRYTVAMGKSTSASGQASVALGDSTNASGDYSVAMGRYGSATGYYSTTMGLRGTASGDYSVALGRLTTSEGDASFAMGLQGTASGDYSVALGRLTTSEGDASFAMGYYTTASGENSVAMGEYSSASGENSVVMGYRTNANGKNSISTGSFTTALGLSSLAMGDSTNANGYNSVAMGYNTNAVGANSFAQGYYSTANGENSMAVGYDTSTGALATNAVATGYRTQANDTNSTSMGYHTVAGGENSVAMGEYSTTSSNGAVAMGRDTLASGQASVAMGANTVASEGNAVAMGDSTTASGYNSVAMGYETTASGEETVAMGYETVVSGDASIGAGRDIILTSSYSGAIGQGLTSSAIIDNTFIVGKWNVVKDATVIVGIGNGIALDPKEKANGLEVYDDGKVIAPYLAIDGTSDNKTLTTKEYVNLSGTTLTRPATPSIGQFYFDTDLIKPIWYSGAVTLWVDATGTTV